MAKNKIFLLLILYSIFLLLAFCKSVDRLNSSSICSKQLYCLTNDSIKFWDGVGDYGFMINIRDRSITEYGYDELGRRIKASYGNDIAQFKICWKINQDTLDFILPTKHLYQKNLIQQLSIDSLKLINEFPYDKKKLSFFKAKDQKSLPIEGTMIPSDTSKWIIKAKNK